MKKISGSTWLFIVVVALSAYTYFFEFYKKDTAEKKKAEESKIFNLQKDQVNEVSLGRASEKILLQRTVDGWELIEPMKDLADNDSVENFVSSLVEERTKDLVKEGDGSDDKAFGFGPTSFFIGLKAASGAAQEVEVSSEKNFEGNPFLRIKGDKKIFVGNTSWVGHAGKTVFDFRDKRFLRARIAEAEELEVKNPEGTFKLVSKEGKWQSSAIAPELLDQNRIRELLSSLSEIKAQEFINSGLKGGLTSPTVKINLKVKIKGEEKNWQGEMALGKDKTTAVASNSFPGDVVKIDKMAFDRFNEASLLSLRDRRWPFAFEKQKVKKIEYTTAMKKSKLVMAGNDWVLEPPDPSIEVQQTTVKDLVDRLKTFEATDFLPQAVAKEFKKENSIRLNDESDGLVFEFSWGGLTKKKFNGIEKNIRLAKTSRSEEVFSIEESQFGRLNLSNLTTKKKETP